MINIVNFKPSCMPIAIGSVPHANPSEAFAMVQKYSSECLFWPQLPARGFKENMIIQFTEGMPALRVNEAAEKIFFKKDENTIETLTLCLERIIEDDFEYFKISEDYGAGFYEMEKVIKRGLEMFPVMIKGQVTGPVTFGLTATDEGKKPIIYDPELAEIIVKCIGMKARWQSKRFGEILPGVVRAVIFDEPYLTQIGSAYIGIQPEDAIAFLNDCFEAVDGLTGIHVCGKTDWSLVMKSNVDIIHFDAYDYAEAITLYPAELEAFLSRGGLLAWGVVPTDKNVASMKGVELDSLLNMLENSLSGLEGLGLDREKLVERSFVSPSCGTGSMSVEDAERSFELTSQLSQVMRERYSLTLGVSGLKST